MLTTQSWRTAIPQLQGISSTVSGMLDRQTRQASLSKDTVMFGPGNRAENMFLVTSGTVRVVQCCDAGHKSALYPVETGKTCVLTMACLLAVAGGSAKGIAETDVEAILMPRDTFDALMALCVQFRATIFKAYSTRIAELFKDTTQIVPIRCAGESTVIPPALSPLSNAHISEETSIKRRMI